MLTGDWLDTVLNLLTFAFVGAMVWIYTRKPSSERQSDDQTLSGPDT